jgi:glutamate-1-semialdehyde aminotransferase
VTGRSKVLTARHGYHGSHEAFEAGAWGTGGPRTVLADYGNAASFRAALDDHGPDIAAVSWNPWPVPVA